jgi:hypothetical protein
LKSPTFEKKLGIFKTFSYMVQIGSKKYGMMFKFFKFCLFFLAKCGYLYMKAFGEATPNSAPVYFWGCK